MNKDEIDKQLLDAHNTMKSVNIHSINNSLVLYLENKKDVETAKYHSSIFGRLYMNAINVAHKMVYMTTKVVSNIGLVFRMVKLLNPTYALYALKPYNSLVK